VPSAQGFLRSPAAASLSLLGATAVWGATFPVVKDAITPAGPMQVFDYIVWRFAVATLAMVLLRPRAIAQLGREGRRHGTLLGLALGIGFVTQTMGLQRAPSSVSGFITGMFVVFAPLITALILRRRVSRTAWIAVAAATFGLALLSVGASGSDSTKATALGLVLLISCAFWFGVNIVGLGEWSARYDSYGLALMQLTVVGVVCVPFALFEKGGLAPPPDRSSWFAVILTALAATSLAFMVQTWAQSVLDPTRASVIMTMEPVWTGIFAVSFAGETMTAVAVVGAALVVAGMLLTELAPGHAPTPQHVEP
jgi:drug/metabolite transporter (DMT)-like permease